MLIITLQRKKCIGCNYCVEAAPEYFRMSKKDGKTNLLRSYQRKGFFTYKESNHETYEQLQKAAEVCPVKIIDVRIK